MRSETLMADTISIYEAAKWIAEMAGADGEITPNERKVMKSFAETYGVDFSKLVRMSYAISGNNEQEVQYVKANEMKGRQFEEFVVSFLADKSIFRLLAWRSDKIVDGILCSRKSDARPGNQAAHQRCRSGIFRGVQIPLIVGQRRQSGFVEAIP